MCCLCAPEVAFHLQSCYGPNKSKRPRTKQSTLNAFATNLQTKWPQGRGYRNNGAYRGQVPEINGLSFFFSVLPLQASWKALPRADWFNSLFHAAIEVTRDRYGSWGAIRS